MYDAGQLDIDKQLLTYLPGYAFNPQITLRMLLNQTSGLADYTDFPDARTWVNGVTLQTVLTQVAQAPVQFAPGSAYAYSNSNYFVLGAVIEAVTLLSYSSYIDAQILQPLGLAQTTYFRPAASASPYSASLAPSMIFDPSLTFSAGALWSNTADLTKWDAALLAGNAVPPAMFKLMITPPAVPFFGHPAQSNYGMGLALGQATGHPIALHVGSVSSFTSFNGMLLDSGVSIVLLTNVAVDTSVFEQLAARILSGICTSSTTASTC